MQTVKKAVVGADAHIGPYVKCHEFAEKTSCNFRVLLRGDVGITPYVPGIWGLSTRSLAVCYQSSKVRISLWRSLKIS